MSFKTKSRVKTRLVRNPKISDHERVIRNIQPKILPFLVYLFSVLALSSCNKGFTLKIQDQDVFAFGAQDSCNFITTNVLSNTLRVSWKTATPATFVITPSVPVEYDSDIQSAANSWNSVVGRNLITIVRDNGFARPPSTDGVNAIYWMTDWEPENSTQQARTAVQWDVSKIKDADIRVNAKNFQFYKTGETGTSNRVHFESLMLHELGHAVGLTHNAELNSVMQVSLRSLTIRNQPGAVDISSLKCEY